MRKLDAIIIGSGQGGIPLAKKLAKAGWQTAIIEKRLIGGTCINDGCTPTKSMISCAAAAYTIANSKEWGITVDSYKIDIEKITDRKDRVVKRFRDGATKGLEKTEGLSIIYGEAAFSSPEMVTVKLHDNEEKEEILTAEHIFINAGISPRIPPIPGLDKVSYLTNTTLLDIKKLPSHLVIIGGSYIALEFGQMFRRLGSQVTLLEASAQLLKREDEDVAAAVRKVMETAGITVHTNANIHKVEQTGDTVRLSVASGGQTMAITGSHLLVATGRTPQTKALQPEKAGIALDEKGYIIVNDRLETSVTGIYAIGDIKGGPAFTHISYNDHFIVYKNLVEKGNASIKDRPVPYCMFTDPQLGRVGMTEKAAREAGFKVKVACLNYENVARAIETGHTEGFMKAVVDADTDKILGAAILGAEGGEVMSVVQMAISGGFTATQMHEMVFAHPLYAESLNNLFTTLKK